MWYLKQDNIVSACPTLSVGPAWMFRVIAQYMPLTPVASGDIYPITLGKMTGKQ